MSLRVEFGSHVPTVGDLVIVNLPTYTAPGEVSPWWWAHVKEVHPRARGVEVYATLTGVPAYVTTPGIEPCPGFADTPCTRRMAVMALKTHRQTARTIHDLTTRLDERRKDGVAMGRLAEALVGALQALAPRS